MIYFRYIINIYGRRYYSMKKLKRIFAFSLCFFLMIGCSSKNDNKSTVKEETKKEEKKEEFDTSLMDAKLFDFISEDGVSEDDKGKVQTAYNEVYLNWNMLIPNFLTETHYYDLNENQFMYEHATIVAGNHDMTQLADSGNYTLGDGSIVNAPFDYISSQDLKTLINQLFGKEFSSDNTSASNFYLSELDGYALTGSLGGYNSLSLPKEISVKKYQNMYVAITNYEGKIDETTPISGTFYLVFEKIEENGESKFVYRWFYTHVNE